MAYYLTRILPVAIFLIFGLCRAQTNIETFSQLQFNFNNPGARAAGIGGAFLSIADDATAAEANPAGLTALNRPEISAELKAVEYSRDIFNFSASGNEANFTYVSREFTNSVVSPSFLSFVYPLEKVTLSIFRHELVNFESTFSTGQSFISGFPGNVFFAVNSALDMLVTNWGGAAGYQLNPKLSVGASFGVSQLDVNSQLVRFRTDGSGNILFRYKIDDNETDLFYDIGAIYKASEQISVGAILKSRPRFKLGETVEQFDDNSTFRNTLNFKIPSAFGVGVSYRPSDVLTFGLDVLRIQYSDLTDNFVVTDAQNDVRADEFQADDATEVHLGGEYVYFVRDLGIIFRAGIISEPDNSIEFRGQANGNLLRAANKLVFRKGDSNVHFALGLGLLTQRNFQIDIATDLSDRSKQFVGSFVYRLNK